MAEYSRTPLLKKPGYKAAQSALFIGLPEGLDHLAGEPEFCRVTRLPSLVAAIPEGQFDVIHVFVLAHRVPVSWEQNWNKKDLNASAAFFCGSQGPQRLDSPTAIEDKE